MPSSTRLSRGEPSTLPPWTTQTFDDAASDSTPSRNMMVSMAPWSALIWRASTAPARLVLLTCAFFQRKSSAVTQAKPRARSSAPYSPMRVAIAKTVGVSPGSITWSRIATPRVICR